MSTSTKGYRVIAPDRYLRVLDGEVSVTVYLGEERFASSDRAVRLVEGDRDEVLYLPLADVDASRLVPSGRRFRCRWKGDAAYYHVDLRDRTIENVAWSYPEAPDAIAALRDRVAFDLAAFDVRVDEPAPADGASRRPDEGRAALGRGDDAASASC